jgi:large subunit ribosomal protein L32
MAVPFHRTSKTKKRMRRSHFKLTVSGLITCANCGQTIRSHMVCPQCGFYGKKQVLVVNKAEAAPVEEAPKKSKKAK